MKVGDRVVGVGVVIGNSVTPDIDIRGEIGIAIEIIDKSVFVNFENRFNDNLHSKSKEIPNCWWCEKSDLKLITTEESKTEVVTSIIEECDKIKEMLISKNKKYGNSALEPVRIFSEVDNIEQLKVRIDDKLSRIMTSAEDDTEDTVSDLIGYLILLSIAKKDQK